MHKSALAFWLIAITFIFSAWLNVVHSYEHDEHEPHVEECEICILLSGLTDHLVDSVNAKLERLLAEERYLFTVKNNFSVSICFAKSRAPPHTNNLI